MVEQQGHLIRVLRRREVISLAFGAMIGWSWVALAGTWLESAGSIGTIIAFLVGGVVIAFIGMIYAELASAMPLVGGEHIYSLRALGPTASFVCTWSIIFGYFSVVAFEVVALPTVAEYLFPNLKIGFLWTVAGYDVYLSWVMVGVAGSLVMTCINVVGIRTAAVLQTVVTAFILLAGVLVVSGGLFNGSADNMQPLTVDGINGMLTVLVMVPFPIPYHGVTVESSMAAIEAVFASDIPAHDVAAIIVEPVLGEGGYYPAPSEFLRALRKVCDEHGIVLIADEIQTGLARTGRMFCIEHAGVEPDLMTLAKGLAGGFPLAAVVGKAEIMDAPQPGGLGGTYAASPLGCVAGLAVLDIITEHNLVRRAQQIGVLFGKRLGELQREHRLCVGEIRAERGAMVAMELVKDNDADQPNPELARALVATAARHGLLILSCGIRGNVVRFMPALTITDELIFEGLDILSACLAEA